MKIDAKRIWNIAWPTFVAAAILCVVRIKVYELMHVDMTHTRVFINTIWWASASVVFILLAAFILIALVHRERKDDE